MDLAVFSVSKALESKGATLLKYWNHYDEFYFKILMDNRIFYVRSKPKCYKSKSGFVLNIVKSINSEWVECGEFNSRINKELEYISYVVLTGKEYEEEARSNSLRGLSSCYSEDDDWWCDLDIFH